MRRVAKSFKVLKSFSPKNSELNIGVNCRRDDWIFPAAHYQMSQRQTYCLDLRDVLFHLPWQLFIILYFHISIFSGVSHWRDAKKPNREEKEKFKNNFSTFERRKRNPNSFASSREEKEKSRIFLPSFERRKRNLNSFSQFREEKEKSRIPLPSFEKRKRNWQIYQTFEKRNLKQNSYMDISIYESRKRHFKCW